jgi:aspartate ammonia-lyase
MDIPEEYYYGVQTARARDNFQISRSKLYFYPQLISALAQVKQAAALANQDLGILDGHIANAIVDACEEIREGKFHEHFVVDMMQGGAGTSTNMNANEVIANRALEHLGYAKGEYDHCHPNNHVNLSQSTNDAYPSALRIALYNSMGSVLAPLGRLIDVLHAKATDFTDVLKMGRTQLQDAVPMTLGQEFEAFAATLSAEIKSLEENRELLLVVNMGATAIGTGINSDPRYTDLCTKHLAKVSGLDIVAADNLIAATSDTGDFVANSTALKRLATKLSKICNDLRLLSSGPRAGLGEINLPPMQPGSSIMPGKVNPVIPEVVNQIAFKVIGNDVAITMASEAGQLQLNVMEPVIIYALLESIDLLVNGIETLTEKCVVGITANKEVCRNLMLNSIGLVTALNPYIGYEKSTELAAEALRTGRGIYELVKEYNLLSQEELDDILRPENMIQPRTIAVI